MNQSVFSRHFQEILVQQNESDKLVFKIFCEITVCISLALMIFTNYFETLVTLIPIMLVKINENVCINCG